MASNLAMAAMNAPPMTYPDSAQMAAPPPPKLHDVTVIKRKTYGCAKAMAVPPEEFGISRRARDVRRSDYCCHTTQRPQHELITDGYDPEQVKDLPSYGPSESSERRARSSFNEDEQRVADSINEATRLIEVTEHYIRMDYEGDGVARLYKVVTSGTDGEILKRSFDEDGPYKDDIEEVDVQPFAVMTPIPIPHRIIGRSLADLAMPTQKINTALLRALLDNAYLANNPRPEVAESGTTDNTLDDLLTWRPGAPIRVRTPGTVNWQKIPSIGNEVFPLLEYQDVRLERRTGFSRQGQALDPNVLQNQTATAVNQVFTAAQARMKMVARIFAETGIRDLFLLMHQVIRKNDSAENTVRLRNEWVTVDPRQWKTRTDMTVNVGLGSGGKEQQIAGLSILGQTQEKLMLAPQLNIVGREEAYETAKELTKLLGYKNPERFFKDPAKNPPGEQPPDPKAQEVQGKLQLQQAKDQADTQFQQTKAATDAQIQTQKNQADQQMGAAKITAEARLKQQQMVAEFNLKREQMVAEFALKREEMATEAQLKREQMVLDAQVRREVGMAGAAAKSASVGNVEVGGEMG